LTTTDHKLIGHHVLRRLLIMFFIGGIRLLSCAPSSHAGLQFLSNEQFKTSCSPCTAR